MTQLIHYSFQYEAGRKAFGLKDDVLIGVFPDAIWKILLLTTWEVLILIVYISTLNSDTNGCRPCVIHRTHAF